MPDPRERPVAPRSGARTSPAVVTSAGFDYLKVHGPSRPTPGATHTQRSSASNRIVWLRPTDLFTRAGAYTADRSIAWMVAANRWARRLFERRLILAMHASKDATAAAPSRPTRLPSPAAFGAHGAQTRTAPPSRRTLGH